MRNFTTLIAFLFILTSVFAQAPQKMSYQAVIKDASNNLVISHAVSMRISILQTTSTGTAVYVETQSTTSNSSGLISLEIGSGAVVSGTFATIDWAAGPYFIKTEIDPVGGTDYTAIVGTSQLMSVPYALNAKTADNGISTAEQSKLAGIAAGAEVNVNADWNASSGDAQILNKPIIPTAADGSETKLTAGTNVTVTGAGTTGSPYVVNSSSSSSPTLVSPVLGTASASTLAIGASTPNASAALEISSTTKGFLLSRMTQTQRDAIIPVEGLIVYNSTSHKPNFYNGTEWVGLDGNSAATVAPTLAATTAASVIASTSATSGGNVTADGGTAVTARGVCWSTSTAPVASGSHTTDAGTTGSFTSSMTGLTASTLYYVRAYATNNIGTSYGTEVSFTTSVPAIGDLYLGGKIAYLDASGIHGFVCALADQSTSMQWYNGSAVTTSATNVTLQTTGVYGVTKSGGRLNTDAIIATQGAGTYAASICASLTTGGASAGDWYLPSTGELNQIYINKALLGVFATEYYWSSSEHANNNYAGMQYFGDGTQGNGAKNNTYYVRAIRAF